MSMIHYSDSRRIAEQEHYNILEQLVAEYGVQLEIAATIMCTCMMHPVLLHHIIFLTNAPSW
jgi:hypothetical protein